MQGLKPEGCSPREPRNARRSPFCPEATKISLEGSPLPQAPRAACQGRGSATGGGDTAAPPSSAAGGGGLCALPPARQTGASVCPVELWTGGCGETRPRPCSVLNQVWSSVGQIPIPFIFETRLWLQQIQMIFLRGSQTRSPAQGRCRPRHERSWKRSHFGVPRFSPDKREHRSPGREDQV